MLFWTFILCACQYVAHCLSDNKITPKKKQYKWKFNMCCAEMATIHWAIANSYILKTYWMLMWFYMMFKVYANAHSSDEVALTVVS